MSIRTRSDLSCSCLTSTGKFKCRPHLPELPFCSVSCVSSKAVAHRSLTGRLQTSTYNTLISHILQLPITEVSSCSSWKRMKSYASSTRLRQSRDLPASRYHITIQLQDRLPAPLRNMDNPNKDDVLLRDPPCSADSPVRVLTFKLLGLLHQSKRSGRLK